jgi:hypothetical protein
MATNPRAERGGPPEFQPWVVLFEVTSENISSPTWALEILDDGNEGDV